MVNLLCVKEGYSAPSTTVLAGEHHGAGHLLHGQVPDVPPQLPPAGRAAGELGPAVAADEVAGVALQDRGQHVVETHGALEQAGQVRAWVGGGSHSRHGASHRVGYCGLCGEDSVLVRGAWWGQTRP